MWNPQIGHMNGETCKEMADSGHMAPREERPPADDTPPDGPPPEGLPGRIEPAAGRPLPEALLVKMAEILNLDQQRLGMLLPRLKERF